MADMPGSDAAPRGLFASLKQTIATRVAIGKTRAELLITEIEEEKLRLMSLWSKAIGAAFMLAIGVVLLVFWLALAFWEQRVLVFGLASLLFIGGGLWLVASLKAQARRPSKLFHASLAELEQDIAELRRQAGKAE